jgi:hypothetical protein
MEIVKIRGKEVKQYAMRQINMNKVFKSRPALMTESWTVEVRHPLSVVSSNS